jgi:alpha-ketoglutarate-dependent taurine dioxygenase
MTYPLVIEDASFEDLIDDSDHFVKLFRESKLLIFPELHLSEEQNSQVREAFGYGFYGHHDETHKFAINQSVDLAGPRDRLVPWHLENLDDPYPPDAVGWNLTKMDCPQGCGNTGFINMMNVYSKLDQEHQDFYNDLSFMAFLNAREDSDGVVEIYEKMAAGETTISQQVTQGYRPKTGSETPVRKAVIPHPLTDELTLRYMPEFNFLVLPEFHEQREVADAAVTELMFDPDNQVWWEWSKGDYIFADLVVTAHAVKGGFTYGERVLDVAFGLIGEYPKHLREEWQPDDPRLLPENAIGGGQARGIDGVVR